MFWSISGWTEEMMGRQFTWNPNFNSAVVEKRYHSDFDGLRFHCDN